MECENPGCRQTASDEDYGKYDGKLCPWHIEEAFQMEKADAAVKAAKEN